MKKSITIVASLFAMSVAAQDLKIGLSSQQSSLDPHFHNLTPNNQLRRHIFEGLTDQNENQQAMPSLAESFKAVSDTMWEFKLRKGVKFTNGDDFTANDVVFSLCRVPKVENSPSSFTGNTKSIKSLNVVDNHTIQFTTNAPAPLFPLEMSTIGIMGAKLNGAPANLTLSCDGITAYPKTDDFNSLKLAVGTGPYVAKEFIKGEKTVLVRNDSYWGAKPQWGNITMRPITQAAARVAALLAGDVDFIENPPVQDLPRIKLDNKFVTEQALSSRIIYLHFNYIDDKHPGLTDVGDKNPLRDKRVREAISKAIDRDAIVSRIMGGVAQAAGELLPSPLHGTNANIKHDKQDIEGAKKLLAEAGYPNGFSITLGAPNDRYINDAVIAPALAQMLARVGIKTSVDAMTATTFFQKRNKRDFAMWLAGWGADTGEMSNPLKALAGTINKEKGNGSTNPGGYSNPAMDVLLEKALGTIDYEARGKLLAEASRLVTADYGLIPLHFEVTTWAMKKNLSYKARVDQYTAAMGIGMR